MFASILSRPGAGALVVPGRIAGYTIVLGVSLIALVFTAGALVPRATGAVRA